MSLEKSSNEQLILSKISILEEKMDLIIKLLEINNGDIKDIEKSCNKMNGHIDFIETTYDKLKYPIDVFKNKIEQVFGKEQKKIL
jgi:hypothetical protein